MSKVWTPAERLVVAADFKPEHKRPWADSHYFTWDDVRSDVLRFADSLHETGVTLKINSAARACGPRIIREIHDRNLKVFLDAKANDIPETLSTDGVILRDAKPEIMTVMCSAGVEAMRALKVSLPETEILGVTVLTSLTTEEVKRIYGCSIMEAVSRFVFMGIDAGIGGFVTSPKEARILRSNIPEEMTVNTPGIRLTGITVSDDDQIAQRVMTPADAIKEGVDRLIVGRPVLRASNPRDMVMRILDAIEVAVSHMK